MEVLEDLKEDGDKDSTVQKELETARNFKKLLKQSCTPTNFIHAR